MSLAMLLPVSRNLFVMYRYDWTCNMDEAQLKETVDAIVEHDLVSYGYNYFNLDDCWSKGRHPNGTQYADPAHFPSVCLVHRKDTIKSSNC